MTTPATVPVEPVSPAPLVLRTQVYIQPPAAYEIAACDCGNADCQWSEFEKHLWCAKCEKDFIPEHNGVFDGPIPYHTATMLGMSFDRVEIATGRLVRFDPDKGGYQPPEDPPQAEER